jgi:diguanylate cyclase (GGDEF)-like protein
MRRIKILNKEFVRFLKNRDEAFTDYLTNLPDRRGMYDYYSRLKRNTIVSVLFIDIDNFKQVNDVYGHSVGDELLKTLAEYFKKMLPGSRIFRIGGDEFVAIDEGKKQEAKVISIATELLNGLQTIDFREDVRSQLTLSVGILVNQGVKANLDEILKKCDDAMYRAKQNGKNSCVIFDSLEEEMKKTNEIEEEMEAAYSHNEFVPYLLPKIDLLSGRVYGAELLVRWVHWLDGVRMPGTFVPIFEKNGTVSRLDYYMFEEACKMKEAWRGTPLEKLTLSVNLSPVTFYIKNLAENLTAIADRYKVAYSELEIEVPGKTYTSASERSFEAVKELKKAGFRISLDNFGGLYSPLTSIKELPVDTVKFEKNFIRATTADQSGNKILRNLFALCRDLKVDILAIGVETDEQIETLIKCGCYSAQGYRFIEPSTEEEFIKYALSNCMREIAPVRITFNTPEH